MELEKEKEEKLDDLVEIIVSERNRALRKMVYDIHLQHLQHLKSPELNIKKMSRLDDFDPNIGKMLGLGDLKSNTGKLSAQDTVALFVTFSPNEETLKITSVQIFELALKICKPVNGTLESMFCMEQRGLTEEEVNKNVGVHFRALIVLDKRHQGGERGRQVTRITNILKKYQTTTHLLQIKFVSSDTLQSKIDHIMGNKEKSNKEQNMVITRIWREKNNFLKYYRPVINLDEFKKEVEGSESKTTKVK